MHQALYRKYRPASFDDVCGQGHITDVLRQQVRTGSVSHAYLFCGSRGTGKTTCAKILSKAVNCLDPHDGNPCGKCEVCQSIDAGLTLDVVEMDAASNTGVDYIRDIKEEVAYSASTVKYRVYILDEVHMLTEAAFNALLKTLEEPTANVIFILATTELAKIPATVLSSCLRFDFRRITVETIASRLSFIAEKEEIDLSPDAATLIAVLAGGGMRDAIGMLELAAGKSEHVTVPVVRDVVGIAGREDIERMLGALADRDYATVFGIIAELHSSSKDLAVFVNDVLACCRDMLLIKATKKNPDKTLFELTGEEFERTVALSDKFTSEKLFYYVHVLEECFVSMTKTKTAKRLLCEIAFVQMGTPSLNDTPKALLARISDLEAGVPANRTVSVPTIEGGVMKTEEHPPQPEAEPVFTPAPAPKAPAPDTGAGGFTEKAAVYWSDAVAKYAKADMGTATFLQRARAYKGSDGVLRLYVSDSFSAMMLQRPDVTERLMSIV
ncbi:MAG: DNA polymerase III subunit gamma/tau, partial [Clostridia bacterium]|nr:DNA polymerase III subunit gamma/tau [Clostridia bacterium]